MYLAFCAIYKIQDALSGASQRMRVLHKEGIFVAVTASTEEAAAAKTAGFQWHPGHYDDASGCEKGPSRCYGCKVGLKRAWWTRRGEAAARLSAYADADARAALAEHLRAVEMSRATDTDITIPAPKGLEYLGYQKAGIAYMAKREGTLLGDEQGCGKTIQILGLINLDKTIKSVLVLCPATIRGNWKRETTKWLVADGRQWLIHVVDEDEPLPPRANFVICHYNRVSIGYKTCEGACGGEKRKPLPCPACNGTGNGSRHPLLCNHCKGKKFVFCDKCRGKGRVPFSNIKIVESLMKKKWDLICADEAHFLKNLNARRTKAVIGDPYKKKTGLADLARMKVYMTGTPIPNRPIEIWPIVASLAPKDFGNFKSFAIRYCAGHDEFISKTQKVFKFEGASNLEELQEKLRSTCLVADTMISTENGQIPIGEIVSRRSRLRVWTVDALGCLSLKPIVGWSKKTHRELLIKIRFAESEFFCTPEHGIYTDKGLKRADKVEAGDHLLALQEKINPETQHAAYYTGVEDLLFSLMWRKTTSKRSNDRIHCHQARAPGHSGESVQGLREIIPGKKYSYIQKASVLHISLSGQLGVQKVWDGLQATDKGSHRKKSCKNEGNQKAGSLSPDEGKESIRCHQGEHVEVCQETLDSNQEQFFRTPRKDRCSYDKSKAKSDTKEESRTSGYSEEIEFAGYRLGSAVNSQRWEEDLCRYPNTGLDHYRRNRWTRSRSENKKEKGQGERFTASPARVLSVETMEMGCGGKSGRRSKEDTYVYDIEVAENHNFFANGALVHNCLIRRLKIDVLKDLPPKRRQIIPLQPTPEAKKLIAQELEEWDKKFGNELALIEASMEIAEDSNDLGSTAYTAAVDKLKYIQNIAFIEMAKVRRQIAVVKLPTVIEYLEGMFAEGVKKIICFAHHKEVIQKITEHFKDIAVSVYGETKKDDRDKNVDLFQDEKSKVQLFVGGITAAGVGITLTASSNTVFAELDWTPGNMNQAEDRSHRIGQQNSVLIQHLVLDGSLDARMAQMVVEKQEIADRALDKSTDVAVRGFVAHRAETPVTPVPLWKKAALKEALVILAKRRDKEITGGHGFSQFDAPIGQSLATRKGSFSDKQAHLAIKLVTKYRRQLSESNDKLAKQLDVYQAPEPVKPVHTSTQPKKNLSTIPRAEQLQLLGRIP